MLDIKEGIVYHYCSLETFKSILENKCLWLCDLEKSNDSAERVYFENIMLEEIDHYENNLLSCNSENAKSDIELLHMLKEALQDEETERVPVYFSSFSYNSDQLSQWRGYADDGYGVAIGFSSGLLQENLPRGTFYSIDYSQASARAACQKILQDAFVNSRKVMSIGDGLDYRSHFCMCALKELERHNIFFKSDAFREENECRIAMRTESNWYSVKDWSFLPASPCIEPDDSFSDIRISREKFRVSQHKLSSYLELSFEEIKDWLITEISIGPKCLAEPKDIRHFLKCNGYEADDITITVSSATYR